MSSEEVMAMLRQIVDEVDVDEAVRLVEHENAVLVDVREENETARGVIPGARCVPLSALEPLAHSLDIDPDIDVIVYCATGRRSLFAANMLTDAGFTKTHSLSTGIVGWLQAGKPIVSPNES